MVGAFQVGRVFGGGATSIGWVTSRDGARHVTSGVLPGLTSAAGGPYAVASDPTVAYDAAHGVWLISSLAVNVEPEAVVVSRSRDGRRWSAPVTVAAGQPGQRLDKNWTVCDSGPRSPSYGHCYTEFDDNGDFNRIKMSTSTDGGLTWSAPVTTAGNDFGIGGQPVVQPDGTVIVPIENLAETGLLSFRSTDGGRTWSAAVPVTPTIQHKPAGGLRAPLFPSAEVDRDGKVYAAWPDCRFRTGCSANDLVLSTTTDGIGWSPVRRIPIDAVTSGADHFIPGLAVDPRSSGASAHLALTYYTYPDADCTVATCELDVAFTASRDGGASWSAPQVLAGPMRLDLAGGHLAGAHGRRLHLHLVRPRPGGAALRAGRATERRAVRRGDGHRPRRTAGRTGRPSGVGRTPRAASRTAASRSEPAHGAVAPPLSALGGQRDLTGARRAALRPRRSPPTP